MKTKSTQMPTRSSTSAIAVIGMGCHYPGASEIQQLWENILAKRRQFRQLPDRRLPLSEYYDPDPQVSDKTYGSRAAVIDGFEFDWVSKRIPKTSVESTDIVHWLALEVALKALQDSGYTRESVVNERAGVILGNTLTGEQTRASTMRLRWPYVRRALRAAAKVKGLPPQVVEELVETMETFYKSAFSPITEDSLAGGLSNTIAGRICNFLDFHGGGYTVDGACSSSLIAVATAATALANGDLDLALAGGVDVSLDTFELIGFAKTGALTKQDMTVYDRKASGFIPGEGCGFVVLKRLEDARAAGDYVYAIIQGWGISSDGKGGITAPSSSGQAKALRRAYERAGYSPHKLDFIEGHGTGTSVGDRVELEGIALAINSDGELKPRSVGVTSFKSLVGHTKAAAGIGGFIKAVIAVNQRVLPPTAACKDPNPVFEGVAQSLYPILAGEVRDRTETLRAGISAMGFGGINCHAIIKSGDAPASHLKPSIEERVLLVSNQETEIFVLSAGSVSDLCDRARAAMEMAAGMCIAELVDLAAQLSGELESQLPVKAAIVAGTPEELVERLQRLVEMLEDTPLPKGQVAISAQKDIWIGNTVKRSRVGFLFPGQGSQKLNIARTLVERYSWARELLHQADRWLRELGVEPISEFIYRPLDRAVNKEQVQEWSNLLASTKVAQPAICFVSLLWKQYLERLGINPVAVGGHSLGELIAFQAAEAFDEKTLLCLAAIRGQAMSTNTDVAGTMASLSCSQETAEKLLQPIEGYVVVANINSPQQTVISGEKSSVEEAIALAAARNIQARQLPVSNAFHSQMVATAAEHLRAEALIPEELIETSTQIFSSVNGQLVEPGINLREHFANQVIARVDFVSLVKAIASECDLLVEVGSGKVLSDLANAITAESGFSCLPLESKPEYDRDLNAFLGSFFVHGGAVNWEALYENRLVRPFVPASQRIFIENPCERPFVVSGAEIYPDVAISLDSFEMKQTTDSGNESDNRSYQANATLVPTDEALLEILSNYFVQRGSFLAELMQADLETLPFPLTPTQTIASDSKNLLNKPQNEELVKLLSNYFAQRGSFLARAIRADLQTLPDLTELKGAANQNSTVTHNDNIKAHDNGTNTTQTIQPLVVSHPTPQQQVQKQKEVIHQQIPDVEKIIVDLVVQQTGYPLESIELNLQLLDDLNLDSIKAGELVAAAARKCSVAGQLDTSSLANATLKEVAETIRSAMLTRETAIATATHNTATVISQTVETVNKSVDLSELLLNLIEERTGFLQKTLSMDLRLLDDLNLDSIKAADLVAALAKQVGVTGELDPSTLANATLADVVAAVGKAQPAPQPKIQRVSPVVTDPEPTLKDSNQKIAEISHWVRNFAIEYVPEDASQKEVEDWSKAKVLIVADEVEHPIAKALSKQLLTQGAQVKQVTYDRVSAENNLPIGFSHYLAVLPQISSQSEQQSLPLARMLVRLKSIATPKADTNTCIAYVQFGGGRFGSSDRAANLEMCCTAAFARSLHLERSNLRVRVVDLALEIEPNRAAELVMTELGGKVSIATVGYDADLVRLVPRSYLQQPTKYSKRAIAWSERDVILVTGGAKGITSECVLALAQSTGVKMALVGSSPAPTPNDRSGEITRTLAQFQAKGLTCRYYSCDITKADAVARLVETINAELGAITGVIHGAGLNIPRRVEQVSLDLAQAEVSPKLLGAYNLCQALTSKPPKLFVAFSSIIGVTGMPGNAWYGFANEALDIMLRRFETEHPETSVLSVAYSVWGEVGMGAKMRSVKHLARMGIGAIPTHEGVDRFLNLFECDPGVKQVIVAARLGGLDTWSPIPLPAASKLRFIEQVLYVEPGVELKARTHLSLDRDIYIRDHIWRGCYLFPTVFGLEAMAQATTYVTGEVQPQIVRIENISLSRPVVVNLTTGVEIEIHAEVMEADAVGERRVKVGIRTEQTGFTTDHFAATLVLGNRILGEKVALQKEDKVLDLNPQTDLYGDLLFQGPLFQRMRSIFSLTEESSIFCSYVRSEAELLEESFAPNQGKALVLGDPYFRDVLLQSVQLTIPQHICLPVHIDKIELFENSSSDAGSRVVSVLLQKREGREYIGEVVTTDDRGYVVERLTGYQLRILEEHPQNPTAVELAFPQERDRDRLHQALTTTFKKFGLALPAVALGYAPNLQAKPKKQRLDRELPIIALALRTKLGLPPEAEIDFGINTLPSGKPEFTGASTVGLDLSLSHCDRYCLCVVEETAQGCDIEAITHRTAEDWVALLSVSRSLVVDELVQGGDTRDRAATRIWSALEAVRKAFNGTNPVFSVVSREGEGVLLQTQTSAGNYFVVTVPIKLTRPPERMVAIVVPQSQPKAKSLAVRSSVPSSADRDNYRSGYTNDGPQGQLVYEQRFQASFKDSGSISRRVYFSQYFRWVGQIRELPMESIASQMLSDFSSGEWGMVTNAVSLRVLGEATSYDTIRARAWVGNVVGSSFDTYIEFCKVLPDDTLERLAIAQVKATWVHLVSYGVPSPMPFPNYLEEYIERFAAKQPATIDLKKLATLPLPPLPASLAQLDSGRIVYQTPIDSNRYGKLLRSEVFQTTLEESNLIGNVYYGNYFIWQGRTLDLFLYSVAPQYLRVSNPPGEMICLYTRMDYLREAMPFDKIRVLLYVQSVSECGAVFNFEFFREQPDSSIEKLHVGQQEVVWVTRLDDGSPVSAAWPPEVIQALV
ncbi:SDR family NAD(P)-dependent oxidoreductase [Aerosakkonemataceae cyanobacterium BLCC-F50]|uniref:SDR family NAD(P)-dependent oxidoreductase n=1 Tax=Floridaenema flaviceps BLCC-F50 TaxID=3153642 RepID=A0ABV4XLP1_9CYAN